MRPAGRLLMVSIVLLASISSFGYFFWYKPKFGAKGKTSSSLFRPDKHRVSHETIQRLKRKALLAKYFVTEHE